MTHRFLPGSEIAGLDQIAANHREDGGEALAVGFVDIDQSLNPGHLADLTHLGDQGEGIREQIELLDAPIGGVRPALDQLGGFQTIELARQCDRLDFENVSEPALLNAFGSLQDREHLPLRSGQPEPAGILLEALAQKARSIVEQETEGEQGCRSSLS